MTALTLTQAFAKYGAKLRNPRFDFTAIAADGSLVYACWDKYCTTPKKGTMRYSDHLSRMKGKGRTLPGKELLKEHLELAFREKLPVRAVMVKLKNKKDEDVVDAGQDSSGLPKTFYLKETHTGKVVVLDEDGAFVIDFIKDK